MTSLLLRDSLRPVAIGLAVGLVAAILGGHVMQSALYGIDGRDPIAMVAAVAILIVAATAAAIVPVRAATRVEPARVLREISKKWWVCVVAGSRFSVTGACPSITATVQAPKTENR